MKGAPHPIAPWLDERLAPNGRSVRENFARWFGDAAVVAGDGTPLVAYHGTNADIAVFTPGADGGIHFGGAAQASMRVAGSGKNLLPVYLSIRNPRRSKDCGGKWKGKIASAKAAGHDGIVYLNRYEGISVETTLRAQREGVNLDALSDAAFRKFAPEAQDSYIAFRPEQVKSAVGNSGNFDPTNASIADTEEAPAPARRHSPAL